ncbi:MULTISPECIES: TrbG/VirB9 family P-type conjugative transfer protein [Pseudomonas syringae group]|uniref:P-type conjugative transfer protein VirB9 n=1 Tax=Pseudomonas syringae pv. ribicola TaxID=55398 RepID=A0A3M2W099_PSESI|nr:TrbG/VirB9 family P-type conjugative transfer protein [Pseudomonas syringae group genomosp. 3]RML44969.1 hypothetical protein ALQ95_200096 [Pseudomonas syringae pv. ribicola]
MKHVCLLALLIFPALSHAASIPQSSAYDFRMQKVAYNPANITVVYTRLGFVSTVIFGDDEVVVGVPKTGFDPGWSITADGNKISISPRPVIQEQDVEGENGEVTKVKKVFSPVSSDWRTNLFVSTNKKNYSLELMLLEEGSKREPSLVVNYTYPDDARLKADQEERAREKAFQAAQEKKVIAQKLENGQTPRNWDYFMRAGKDSQNITPDFAYDDGVMTYIGFAPGKIFPSAFLYLNGKEQVVNFSVYQKGNYKVMVIHDLKKDFVLRHGEQVIGVVNQSFGKVMTPYKSTSSTEVERVEVNNGQ